MLLSFNAFAQKEVKGVVIDKYGFPIEGVKVSSGNEIVYTNDDGTFSINSSMDYLRFEKASFLAITKPTKELLEVVMNEDPLTKEVELPYNKKDVLELTSSVSTLNSCDIVDQYVSSIGSLLAGKLPGLTVLQSTDEPGNSIPKFYLRGRGSWNVASPRIYIDGFESSMDYLNVSEIETISILKDAAALAQFGIKGADGVIYITTKRGQIGKPKVNVNFHQGFQTPISLPKSIDPYTYASLYNEAYSNDRGEWMPYYNDKQLAAYKKR
jgi:TonB-dependent outer membrane receptor, SusC/RagA subfamily, signature region